MNSKVEEARLSFKPDDVHLLFVGESAPAGGVFFYYGNSGFTRYTRQAFETSLNLNFESDHAFLNFFRDSGCWLDDISHEPVNKLLPAERRTVLRKQTAAFTRRLDSAAPDYLIVTLKSIVHYVMAALETAEVSPKVRFLPFPGNSHQLKYREQLVDVLKEARDVGALIVDFEAKET